jgi:hypothetical protein
MDEEASVSPPHYPSTIKASSVISSFKSAAANSDTMLMASEFKKAKIEAGTPPNSSTKKRSGGSGAGLAKGKSSKPVPKDANGAKRVYSCPHCQRSYDWNYNLNRHLKYECGKENAFQCSKCGRKFPHKQNCVYHLKRKHKIVCDTIDQYMSAGLVVFRGSNNPGGQQVANPQDAV